MDDHQHDWILQYAIGGVDRYRCDCGVWGWKTRKKTLPIRAYSGGRTFDTVEDVATVRPVTDWGGRIEKLPTLDDYDGDMR